MDDAGGILWKTMLYLVEESYQDWQKSTNKYYMYDLIHLWNKNNPTVSYLRKFVCIY